MSVFTEEQIEILRSICDDEVFIEEARWTVESVLKSIEQKKINRWGRGVNTKVQKKEVEQIRKKFRNITPEAESFLLFEVTQAVYEWDMKNVDNHLRRPGPHRLGRYAIEQCVRKAFQSLKDCPDYNKKGGTRNLLVGEIGVTFVLRELPMTHGSGSLLVKYIEVVLDACGLDDIDPVSLARSIKERYPSVDQE